MAGLGPCVMFFTCLQTCHRLLLAGIYMFVPGCLLVARELMVLVQSLRAKAGVFAAWKRLLANMHS